jgi:glycosylphosphatidylinositol transamidase
MVSLLCKFMLNPERSLTNVDSASGVLLRHDPRVLKIPPYLSILCILVGVAWLLVLPLNDYSRRTYISENALLPGQVHTYFAGSDQNIFRGYKKEVDALVEEQKDNIAYVKGTIGRGRI